MVYALYRKGSGGTIRHINGNPRSPANQRKMVVWTTSKKGVKSWIREFGTTAQKQKHL